VSTCRGDENNCRGKKNCELVASFPPHCLVAHPRPAGRYRRAIASGSHRGHLVGSLSMSEEAMGNRILYTNMAAFIPKNGYIFVTNPLRMPSGMRSTLCIAGRSCSNTLSHGPSAEHICDYPRQ
jgi:hypothetical protein